MEEGLDNVKPDVEEIKIGEPVIDVNTLKPVESLAVDLNQFDKKEVVIEKVETVRVPSQYNELGTQWVLKVSSVPLLEHGEGDLKIVFRASELFNLVQDEEGNLKGYPTNENSNLQLFMKDIKANEPKDIIGKKALIKAYDKKDRTYLKFRY